MLMVLVGTMSGLILVEGQLRGSVNFSHISVSVSRIRIIRVLGFMF